MRFTDLFTPFLDLPWDEQVARVRQMRIRRNYERPALKMHIKKERKGKIKKAQEMLDGLNPDQLKALLESELGG